MNESQRNPLALFHTLQGGQAGERKVYKTYSGFSLLPEISIFKFQENGGVKDVF